MYDLYFLYNLNEPAHEKGILNYHIGEQQRFRQQNMWATAWQSQQNDLCAQRRLRSAWASAQSDHRLGCPHEEALGPLLPIEHTAKTPITLGRCPGWSESLLGPHIILLVLSCGSSGNQRKLRKKSSTTGPSEWLLVCAWRFNKSSMLMSHLMRLWYFLSSINLFFNRACHPMGIDVRFLVGPFIYFHTLCVPTAKAPVRLRGCAGSPEATLLAYVISISVSLSLGSCFGHVMRKRNLGW